MSTMLEQAIIDANALREVAIKNAEAAVIEKYSDQVKEAMEKILEQDTVEEEITMQVGGDSIVDNMPLAATDGESVCPCPDEEEEVEINFDELTQQMAGEGEVDPSELETHEAAAEDILALEEEIELDDVNLGELIEKLKVDIVSQKSGWTGDPSQQQYEFAEQELLALEQDTEVKEELAAMRKAVKKLQEEKKNSEKSLKEVTDRNKKLSSIFESLKEKLEESTLMNAKMLYTNKVLVDSSLNERQKTKIVESISKANEVEEAKVIYETLQSTVGTAVKSSQPKSLSEAVNKTTSTLVLSSRKETKANPETDRWRILAGLTKK